VPRRERDVVFRVPLRGFAVPVARFAAEAVPAFRAVDLRAAPVLAVLARVVVLRVPVDLRVVDLRAPLDARCAVPRDEAEPELVVASPSNDHFPDITR